MRNSRSLLGGLAICVVTAGQLFACSSTSDDSSGTGTGGASTGGSGAARVSRRR